jgi:hypothetical protein
VSLGDAIRDLLLDSPIPPPNWLPDKSWRHDQARAIIARRFSDHSHPPLVSSYHLRHLGSAFPTAPGSRIVPGREIEAELEIELSQLNPPILQGWLVGVAVDQRHPGWRERLRRLRHPFS